MLRKVLILVFFLVLPGCGKNDAVAPMGSYNPYGGPISQAPYPPSYPPGGYMPPPQGYPPGGYFQPQMPPQYGPQAYPWAPMYNYYAQHVNQPNVFINIYVGWQGYAQQNQIPANDFTTFWYDYCPQVMQPQQYAYFSSNFYSWMDPSVSFSSSCSAGSFWQNYSNMPY